MSVQLTRAAVIAAANDLTTVGLVLQDSGGVIAWTVDNPGEGLNNFTLDITRDISDDGSAQWSISTPANFKLQPPQHLGPPLSGPIVINA